MILQVIAFGIFGLIIGSFLNVLILRRGIKSLLGRSGCLSCGHELEAVDLVPIISWLALTGRCRFCGSRISFQYPLVEAATAILFAFIGGAPIPLVLQVLALPPIALLIAISAYDLRHTIIPDLWAFLFVCVALVFSLVHLFGIGALSEWLPLALSGPGAAFPFWALWYFSGGTWMGLGDAKLAWGIGWLLGPLYTFIAIVCSFVIGAFISVCILLPLPALLRFAQDTGFPVFRFAHARFTMGSEVAFGPFLAAGSIIIWLLILYGIDPAALFGAASL